VETYRDDDAARRALYVAVTRARHEVALACVGERSPMVP
jgi:DNA helicase IV